jgi:hypothetical protein
MPPKLYNRLNDVSVMGPEYQALLHTPSPTLGWHGDPDLTLAYHGLTGWDVLREEAVEDGRGGWTTRHKVIAQCKTGVERFDPNELIRGLVERDTRVLAQSHQKAVDNILKSIDKEEADRSARMVDAVLPVHEKLAWQTAKETGNLAPFIGQAGLSLPAKDAVDS